MNLENLSDEELDRVKNDAFNESMNRYMKKAHQQRVEELKIYIAWRDHYFGEFNEWNIIGINPSTCDHPKECEQSVGAITAICTKCGEYFDDINDGTGIYAF